MGTGCPPGLALPWELLLASTAPEWGLPVVQGFAQSRPVARR